MGRQMDWGSLNTILEYLEIKEVDLIISSLLVLKEYTDEMRQA